MHNEWSIDLFKGDNMLFCYPVGKKRVRQRSLETRGGGVVGGEEDTLSVLLLRVLSIY